MGGKLEIVVDGLTFPNPFIIGSGPPSTNAKIMCKAYAAGWGGVVAKTTSLTDTRVINVQPRYGKLRSPSKDNVGFQNIELISDATFETWEDYYKETKDAYPDRILIGSIMESHEKGRWQELAGRCLEAGCDSLELNFSCPHGHPETGMGAAMGQNPAMVEEVTRWVVEVAGGKPVWAKMTPNITDIRIPATSAKNGGANGVAAINTILACIGINLKTLKPQPTVEGHSTYGGYSYIAVRPIALRMVSQIARELPGFTISGIGGVSNANSAIEHMLVGASTVQSCTGPMLQGFDMVKEMIDGTEAFLDQHGFGSVREIVGKSLEHFTTHHHLVDLQADKRAKRAAQQAAANAVNKDSDWGQTQITDQTKNLTSNE